MASSPTAICPCKSWIQAPRWIPFRLNSSPSKSLPIEDEMDWAGPKCACTFVIRRLPRGFLYTFFLIIVFFSYWSPLTINWLTWRDLGLPLYLREWLLNNDCLLWELCVDTIPSLNGNVRSLGKKWVFTLFLNAKPILKRRTHYSRFY